MNRPASRFRDYASSAANSPTESEYTEREHRHAQEQARAAERREPSQPPAPAVALAPRTPIVHPPDHCKLTDCQLEAAIASSDATSLKHLAAGRSDKAEAAERRAAKNRAILEARRTRQAGEPEAIAYPEKTAAEKLRAQLEPLIRTHSLGAVLEAAWAIDAAHWAKRREARP